MAEMITVQVCYATPELEFLRELRVPLGTTLEQAIAQSGLLLEVPEIDLASARVGIYAKKQTLATVLREHDRVEVYRALLADPRKARRRRVAKRD
ncbi:RnfH family protein [Janthinobacterium sp.]|uniref:RnfH family protein n=1 Tax=Janthinobacterium sp. TaxID=1871054 RepID=UPI00293D8C00|nr:RnfH family protein [Janthinobacterium sp.]